MVLDRQIFFCYLSTPDVSKYTGRHTYRRNQNHHQSERTRSACLICSFCKWTNTTTTFMPELNEIQMTFVSLWWRTVSEQTGKCVGEHVNECTFAMWLTAQLNLKNANIANLRVIVFCNQKPENYYVCGTGIENDFTVPAHGCANLASNAIQFSRNPLRQNVIGLQRVDKWLPLLLLLCPLLGTPNQIHCQIKPIV